MDAFGFGLCLHFPTPQQGLDLRAKQEAGIIQAVVQRLLAQAIARQQKSFSSLVPDSKGEHPSQLLQALIPYFFIKMKNDFGVCARAEDMTFAYQPLTKILEVIN